MYVGKGRRHRTDASYYRIALEYVTISYLIDYQLSTSASRPSVLVGWEFGRLLRARHITENPSRHTDMEKQLRSLDVSLCLGARIRIPLDRLSLLVEARGVLGLVDIHKEGDGGLPTSPDYS